ncbi:MAG: tetratricopeptide repeat protein [Treponema sp.]|nr:tetratricopeptide repeat protein [Treponema sp.]
MIIRKTAILLFLTTLFISCKDEVNEETLILYSRASAAYTQGRFEETSSMLEKVKDFSPALVLRSKALYFSGRGNEAEVLLRRILHKTPGSGEAALFLARILREQDREDEAQKVAEMMLRNNPQDIRALRLASDLALQRGDAEDAAALLDRAVEASAETALVFVDRAKLRWTAGNGGGALEDLRKAELLLPWNTSLNKGIGDLRTVIDTMETLK